jgi:hypothetical protein
MTGTLDFPSARTVRGELVTDSVTLTPGLSPAIADHRMIAGGAHRQWRIADLIAAGHLPPGYPKLDLTKPPVVGFGEPMGAVTHIGPLTIIWTPLWFWAEPSTDFGA